jgi:hypothetical protein
LGIGRFFELFCHTGLDAYMDIGSRAMQEQLPSGIYWANCNVIRLWPN